MNYLGSRSYRNASTFPISSFSAETQKALDRIEATFSHYDAENIKSIERKINHDAKAIEYFLKSKIENINELSPHTEFVHFSCTSEDINNLAYALMLKDAAQTVLIPKMEDIIGLLRKSVRLRRKSNDFKNPRSASITDNYGERASELHGATQTTTGFLKKIEYQGKFNGAVGNYNALSFAYPNADWIRISEEFVHGLGLSWNEYTTQIEPHDYLAEFLKISRDLITSFRILQKICGLTSQSDIFLKK